MSTTRAGIFIPSDVKYVNAIEIYEGPIDSPVAWDSPVVPDTSETVISPDVELFNDEGGDAQLEVSGCLNIDTTLYPLRRSQISQEILDAIAGGSMSVAMRGRILAGASGVKLCNTDLGYNYFQQSGTCGLYQDHKTLGSVIFNKDDKYLSNETLESETYFGKSRLPTWDTFTNARFLRADKTTLFTHDEIFEERIYSDDDFIYAVAGIVSDTIGGYIGFFKFDPYYKAFIYVSKVEDVGTDNDDANLVYNKANQTVFLYPDADGPGPVPISPSLCRIKSFKNKLVCSFMKVRTDSPTRMAIMIYDSFDNGLTWNKVSGLIKEFWDIATKDGLFSEFVQFRCRMVSDGHTLLLVWATVPSGTNRKYRQMRWLLSQDGGKTWNYDIGSNMMDLFQVNDTEYDNVNIAADETKPWTSVYFGLTVDSRNRYVIARCGEGYTHETEYDADFGGSRYIVFCYTDDNVLIKWKYGGNMNINNDYNQNIIGMYEKPPFTVFEDTDNGANVCDVELFTDKVHGWNYAIIKVQYLNETHWLNLGAYYTQCIVRYAIIPSENWVTNPDWTDSGVGKSCGENVLLMEPPNMCNAICVPYSSADDIVKSASAVFHRGHIVCIGDIIYDGAGQYYKYMMVFRSWNNVPIGYSMRHCYVPITGIPEDVGYTLQNANGANAYVIDQENNDISFSISQAQSFAAGIGLEMLSITGPAGDPGDYPLSPQESVTRFTVWRGDGYNIGNRSVNIFDVNNYNADPAIAGPDNWMKNKFSVHIDAIKGFTFYSLTTVAFNDPVDNNISYEYMLIRNGKEWSLWRREALDYFTSKIINRWYYVNSGNDPYQGAVGAFGQLSIKFGAVYIPQNAFYNEMDWGFSNFSYSLYKSDIYPWRSNYKNTPNAGIYQTGIESGVLSGEYGWELFCYSLYSDSSWKNCRGEFASPNPIWMGTDWLVSNQGDEQIPSDFFIKLFGSDLRAYNTWKLLNPYKGSVPKNVLDDFVGHSYLSSRDGAGGVVPGGVNLGSGDVEVVLQRIDGGYISANSAVIMNCNATDVRIYAQNDDPSVAGGWTPETTIGTGRFHLRDDEEGLPYFTGGSVTDGVIKTIVPDLREGVLVGARLLVCSNTSVSHYGIGANATVNKIENVKYNNKDRIQVDDYTYDTPGNTAYRVLHPNSLISFAGDVSYRYWRFIFTNNANNGDKIRVGLIRLGKLLVFDENFNGSVDVTNEAQTLGALDKQVSYGNIKQTFNLQFNMVDTSSSVNNFSIIKSAFEQSSKFGTGVFFMKRMYSDEDYTSNIYYCGLKQFSTTDNQLFTKSFKVILEEQ